MSTKEVRDLNVQTVKHIEQKYSAKIEVFNEIGCNFDNARKRETFQN